MEGSKDKCPVCGNRRFWGVPFFMGPRKYFICGTIEDENGVVHMDQKVCKLVASMNAAARMEAARA